jgi:hypothetical protein
MRRSTTDAELIMDLQAAAPCDMAKAPRVPTDSGTRALS